MPAQPRGAAAKAATTRALKAVPDPKESPAKAAPAKKAAAEKAPAVVSTAAVSERAEKARATREAAMASGETKKCAGPCGLTKAITAFPTTARRDDGTMGRGKICRACRDAGRSAKAKPEEPKAADK